MALPLLPGLQRRHPEAATGALHEPTEEELLQLELMRLRLDPEYKPKHPNQWQHRFLSAVKKDWRNLEQASDEHKNDKEIVMAAVTQDGRALEYASDELKNDGDVVMTALMWVFPADDITKEALLKRWESIFGWASEALKNDKEFMMAAATMFGGQWRHASDVMRYASEALRNDKEFVMTCVGRQGDLFQFASEALRNDKEVVMAAAKTSRGSVLQYASEALKNDKEVVVAAVTLSYSEFRYASEALKNDKEFVMALMRDTEDNSNGNRSSVLHDASEALQNDPEIRDAAGWGPLRWRPS